MSPTLSPKAFVQKWSHIRLKETAAAQSHFNDVCALVGHQTPTEIDPAGEFFTFEAPTDKTGGQRGRADVWYKAKFVWEYKGPHANLDKAYQQLLLYREALGNPPVLITSDTQTIIIHTNFTNTIKEVHEVTLDRLLEDGLDLLKRAFYDPESFRPTRTQQQVTRASADTFVSVVDTLKQWEPDADPVRIAHFVIRLLFCLFSEDMGLLPEDVFTQLVCYKDRQFPAFVRSLQALFAAMRDGGVFGPYPIPWFDGTLFDDEYIPELPSDIMDDLTAACRQDWSGVDPSILGSLFERAIDPDKRAQLGAHYTSREDILLIVEPVLMRPLRDKWQSVKARARSLLRDGYPDDANEMLRGFSAELAATSVLDPACGSGNFLYVALQQLLDLQKEVIAFAGRQGLDEIPLTAGPDQLYGIEINAYAHELAQVTVWIGYIQWRFENGFADFDEPILRPLRNIERRDAILAFDDGKPMPPRWPACYAIVSNPPFLGSRKMRPTLGNSYCTHLRRAYEGRIRGLPDLVCYWFDRAEAQIAAGEASRAGLLATQAIRGSSNRQVLDRIKKSGDIFLAWSDKEWILDGATVHVSIIGFDNGAETLRVRDGIEVSRINPDLTSGIDLTGSLQLAENDSLAFQGVVLRGPFNIDESLARRMISAQGNPGDRSNREVIRPRRTGHDVVSRPSREYVIDFGMDTPREEAQLYLEPFAYVQQNVYPMRQEANQPEAKELWWLHWNPRAAMRAALSSLPRFIATPRVGKHRVFVWLHSDILPDAQLIVFARSDDYFLGVLHSRCHELWSRRKGTQLRDAASGFRYTPRTVSATYPFPWPPGQEPTEQEDDCVAAIAQAARDLVNLRQTWLHPPEEDIGVIISERVLKRRTLTNLYNALVHYRENVKGKLRDVTQWDRQVKGIISLDRIEELDHIHTTLDHAVLDAYGWPHTLTDEETLERLLALNLERAG